MCGECGIGRAIGGSTTAVTTATYQVSRDQAAEQVSFGDGQVLIFLSEAVDLVVEVGKVGLNSGMPLAEVLAIGEVGDVIGGIKGFDDGMEEGRVWREAGAQRIFPRGLGHGVVPGGSGLCDVF